MNKANRLEELMDELLETFVAKNEDYGDSFADSFKEFGITSAVVRMNDKMNRIKSLSKKGDRQVKDESLRDSLMDLANYALMTVIELEDKGEEREEPSSFVSRHLGFKPEDIVCEGGSFIFTGTLRNSDEEDDELCDYEDEYDENDWYLQVSESDLYIIMDGLAETECYCVENERVIPEGFYDLKRRVDHLMKEIEDDEESDYEAGRQENL